MLSICIDKRWGTEEFEQILTILGLYFICSYARAYSITHEHTRPPSPPLPTQTTPTSANPHPQTPKPTPTTHYRPACRSLSDCCFSSMHIAWSALFSRKRLSCACRYHRMTGCVLSLGNVCTTPGVLGGALLRLFSGIRLSCACR